VLGGVGGAFGQQQEVVAGQIAGNAGHIEQGQQGAHLALKALVVGFGPSFQIAQQDGVEGRARPDRRVAHAIVAGKDGRVRPYRLGSAGRHGCGEPPLGGLTVGGVVEVVPALVQQNAVEQRVGLVDESLQIQVVHAAYRPRAVLAALDLVNRAALDVAVGQGIDRCLEGGMDCEVQRRRPVRLRVAVG
jgi:hypothetical protein